MGTAEASLTRVFSQHCDPASKLRNSYTFLRRSKKMLRDSGLISCRVTAPRRQTRKKTRGAQKKETISNCRSADPTPNIYSPDSPVTVPPRREPVLGWSPHRSILSMTCVYYLELNQPQRYTRPPSHMTATRIKVCYPRIFSRPSSLARLARRSSGLGIA
jgi:hypothetical protein